MDYDNPNLFTGIRFFLAGFNPLMHEQVKTRIVSEGGVYVAQYSPDCTHVIVHDLILDDPVCVAARRDRKALITSLWLDHSIEAGELMDVSNILYRPLKDLNGIPGAEELVICLTGYHKYLREDIMIMVDLMGAEFSKPLAAQRVTHLVCYKFEGEKYDLGKKLPRIKLINHYWLEDCLKAWKLLPEERYSKSTYEMEMIEAQVNDIEGTSGNITEQVTDSTVINGSIRQNETGRAHDDPVIGSKLSTLSVQGLSNSVRMDEVKLQLMPEQVSGSIHPPKIYNHSLSDEQNMQKTPVKSTLPLIVGDDLGNLSGPSSKRSAPSVNGYSNPFDPRETSKTLNVSAGKSGSSNRITKVCLGSNEKQTFNSEADKVKVTTPNPGVLNSKGLSEVDSVTADGGASGIGLDKKISASEIVGVSSTKGVLPDGKGPYTMHEMEQLDGHSGESRITPKSDKRKPSASKSKNGYSNININKSSETAKASADNSSTDLSPFKSNVKNITSSGVKNKKAKTPTLPDNASFSPELKKLVASKSGKDSVMNSDDQAGCSVPNPPKNKMVSRKTLGSRPKVSKKTVVDQKCSLNKNISGVPETLHLDGQMEGSDNAKSSVHDKTKSPGINKALHLDGHIERNDPAKSSIHDKIIAPGVNKALHLDGQIDHNDHANPYVLDKTIAPHSVDGSTASESNPPLDIALDINDYDKFFNIDTDEAQVQNSPADNTNKQEIPDAKLKGIKKNLALKKGISGRGKKKNVISAPKEVAVYADNDVGGKASEKKKTVEEQTVEPSRKKRRGDQLDNELIRVDELVASNNPSVCDAGKRLKNLATKKRRGTLLLNKSGIPVEVDKEMESALDKDDQHDGGQQPENMSGTSNSTDVLMEITNENGPIEGNVRCTKNGVKQTGKKRRGTLILKKPEAPISSDKENAPVHDEGKPRKLSSTVNDTIAGGGQGEVKGKKIAGKKRRGTLLLSKADRPVELEKENEPVLHDHEDENIGEASNSDLTENKNNAVSSDAFTIQSDSTSVNSESAWFVVSGHRLQRKEFQQLIKRLKGKLCRDSHQWSYQATHFIVPDPIRRTEKFFAAAASGSWILKTDYLSASSQAGKFLPEEPYEWHKNGLTEDGAINLEAPRKWRLLRERTSHGALYGMRIVVYGECIAPPLDTLKRAVKAGDGTILATSPPYTRFLKSGVDFAVVSPGITRADIWVQEFLKHEIPCISSDYLVEYVCKPGYPLDRHVQYNTHEWAAKSFSRLSELLLESVPYAATPENQVSDDLACQVCGFSDREDVMLVCGDESGSTGCGIGTHIDCCDPPLDHIPEEDWFCPKCTES